jgi:hypothetical protein
VCNSVWIALLLGVSDRPLATATCTPTKTDFRQRITKYADYHLFPHDLARHYSQVQESLGKVKGCRLLKHFFSRYRTCMPSVYMYCVRGSSPTYQFNGVA